MNAPFPPPPKQETDSELLGPLPARRLIKKAVILAAGRGRRMGKLTADRPKAALVVGEHALIDWQIAALQKAGVEEIAVVTGHGAQALAGRGATYIHNPNWASGTQVETLLCAQPWIGDEPVIVSYGDILYHPSAALALLERPGDIVIAYDADHRWLWKQRFGNWLKDSETFRLGPGQVLTEIGGKPSDIEDLDGQFMGLMLLTPEGLKRLAQRFRTADEPARRRLDFTRLLATAIGSGERIDTAANVLPWMEVDGPKDLALAQRMTARDEIKGVGPQLVFPTDPVATATLEGVDEPDAVTDIEDDAALTARSVTATKDAAADGVGAETDVWDKVRLRPFAAIQGYRVDSAFAIQNWGRSGSTFVQSLFDDHPQVLSTPNFYSRRYYMAWAYSIAAVPDDQKIGAFLQVFRQWWDTGLVDATAGLHRLGPDRRELAGVKREALEGYLRGAFAGGQAITRRSLFEAAHLAYALARGQELALSGLQILFPVHGQPRGVACALLEDFPEAKFIHTIREPVANVASTIQHLCFNNFDVGADALESTLLGLFIRRGSRSGLPATMFGDRPYLGHLAARDHARFLRLEDLHRSGADVMAGAAGWLGLADDDGLTRSSWDGKVWWNRPESGADSRLGGQLLSRNIESRLGPGDRRKIEVLLRGAPGIREAYGVDATTPRHGVLARLMCVVAPWRQEACPRRTELRSLAALLEVARVLPTGVVRRLRDAAKRERIRGRLLEMTSGAIAVRKKLRDGQKPGTVHAVLLVSATETGWRTRALARVREDRLEQADRLAVASLDEALVAQSISNHVFWILVLTVGWLMSRLGAYVRTRVLISHLVMSDRPSARRQQIQLLDQNSTAIAQPIWR